jgi:hypothetical protein
MYVCVCAHVCVCTYICVYGRTCPVDVDKCHDHVAESREAFVDLCGLFEALCMCVCVCACSGGVV